jgi:hypothetical protein
MVSLLRRRFRGTGRNEGTASSGLPCRRSRVRVPSSAPRNPRTVGGFILRRLGRDAVFVPILSPEDSSGAPESRALARCRCEGLGRDLRSGQRRPRALAPRAIAGEGEDLSFRGCIRGFMGDPPGPTVSPYAARRRFAGRVVRPQRTIRETRLPTPLHLQFTPHRGACGKPRVVPHNRRPQARTYGNGRSVWR